MGPGRAYRLWRRAGLQLPRRRPRKRVASGRPRPHAPNGANQVWAIDFVFDACADGRQLKCLTVADEFANAGGGIDGAGLTRLPALDARGMPAATVDRWSARIGDARSMWQTGVLSHFNAVARALGTAPGTPARAFADLIGGTR